MLRLRRTIGWLLVVVIAIFLVSLLGANLYVQSQTTQQRIQQELSQRLKMPLQIQRISVTPWGGLNLSGITIPQLNDPHATPFLEAKNFRLRVKVRSIFWRPLVIKEVALIGPAVIWPQNESGEWRVPMKEPSVEPQMPPQPEATATAPPETVVEVTPSPLETESKQAKVAKTESTATGPQIRKVRLSDGSFHFLDREKRNVALFDGVQFSSFMRDITTLRGQVRIENIALRDRVFLSALRSPIRYNPDELALPELTAQIAKGQLTGDFSMSPQEKDSPFTVHASFHRLQADQLVAEAGGSREIVRGVLEGTLDATGKTADPDALTGSGTILLQNGRVQQFAVLAAVGQLLQIEELTQLDLEQAEAKYHLNGSTVLIDELILRSPNLCLTATGSISLRGGKLALDSVLAINDKIRSQLFRGIRENFVPTSEPGQYALQFHVGGTVDKPKTDLVERAVGADLNNLGGVIDALLGHGKGKKKKKPEMNTPASSPTP
ncbi:MAG: AsmA-like C-terminal region-containing protein [Chthoniobacterales bacterium]|jgi:type II secretion system protein N